MRTRDLGGIEQKGREAGWARVLAVRGFLRAPNNRMIYCEFSARYNPFSCFSAPQQSRRLSA
jgi:hypothetical protein